MRHIYEILVLLPLGSDTVRNFRLRILSHQEDSGWISHPELEPGATFRCGDHCANHSNSFEWRVKKDEKNMQLKKQHDMIGYRKIDPLPQSAMGFP